MGFEVVAVNVLELAISPGFEAIATIGGLGRFTGWRGVILPVNLADRGLRSARTDSGWRARRLPLVLREQGDELTLRSPIDGSTHQFSAGGLARAIVGLGASETTAVLPPGAQLETWTDIAALPPATGWVVSAVPAEAGRHGRYLAPTGWADVREVALTATGPLVADCECRPCAIAGAGYIAHLFSQGEITAAHLLGWHNLHTVRDRVER